VLAMAARTTLDIDAVDVDVEGRPGGHRQHEPAGHGRRRHGRSKARTHGLRIGHRVSLAGRGPIGALSCPDARSGRAVSSEIASENRFQLRVPATAEHLPIVRQAMRAFLEADGVTDERIEDVLLAVTEACANVVQHAYRDDDGTGDVDLIAAIGDGAVTVTVVDSGLGFAPRVDSPGLGLGLPVMAALATRLEISTRDEGGTVVEMAFEPKTL